MDQQIVFCDSYRLDHFRPSDAISGCTSVHFPLRFTAKRILATHVMLHSGLVKLLRFTGLGCMAPDQLNDNTLLGLSVPSVWLSCGPNVLSIMCIAAKCAGNLVRRPELTL